MSLFQDAQSEPKKLFLALLMKNSDWVGQLMAEGQYAQAVQQMLRIATDISTMATKDKIDPIYEKLERWVHVTGNYTSQEVQKTHRELKALLGADFYSELQIGIIPTASLPLEKPLERKEAINPHLSAKLGRKQNEPSTDNQTPITT